MVAEVRHGVQTIDRIAIPVRDLQRNQDFYVDLLGLKLKNTWRNPDGSPRQTCVRVGDNIIALDLPGVQAGSSASGAPRIGVSVSHDRLTRTGDNLTAAGHPFRGPVEHSEDAPFAQSIYFDDPDGNHLEFCVRRNGAVNECISHTMFETRDLNKAITFCTEALGTGVPLTCGDEIFIPIQNNQMIGLVEVADLSLRSRKPGRSCHMAMRVTREDFNSMVILAARYGGKIQEDQDALRPEGERSIYLLDPDNNRLKITAPAPNHTGEMPADEERWQRIVASGKEEVIA
jgi:catechol 2,3-dioxygenase-like lactoylglutathione lyase family enzyme